MSGRRQGERRGIDLGWFDADGRQLGERRSYEHEDRRADTCALCGKRAAVVGVVVDGHPCGYDLCSPCLATVDGESWPIPPAAPHPDANRPDRDGWPKP